MAAVHNHFRQPFYGDNRNFRFNEKEGRDYCRYCGQWVQGRASTYREEAIRRSQNRAKAVASKQFEQAQRARARGKTAKKGDTTTTVSPRYVGRIEAQVRRDGDTRRKRVTTQTTPKRVIDIRTPKAKKGRHAR